MDLKVLEKFDSEKMHKVYDDWPDISQKSYNSNLEPINLDEIEHFVFAGMGGSGALGDIFSSILSSTNIHVTITKGYHLPKTVDSKTLVVTTSISGNTDETLSVLNLAHNSNCNLIAFSSGGLMESYCKKNSINYRNIPMIHSPRASFTKYLYSMIKVLEPILPINNNDVDDSINQMYTLSKTISSLNLNEQNPSLSLAKWINKIPLIYFPFGLQAAATRFKNSLQENSKIHAITEDVVEACHNGIVSWEKNSNVVPILLRGADDYVKTKDRWEILKEYFDFYGIIYKEIFSVEGSILSKLINLIYLLDYSSIYLSVIREVNPSTVNSIKFVKDRV